ncbi:MAG: glycosyltransferase family 2 protein [Lachnospiraceae bacterium]|nr:glycosyltransferase family 2 protein [Lachnospiraceae bacterium]
MSRIEIILSTYNGEKYIREQLDSIIRSSFKNWHISVSDDCSTDSTCDILREYVQKYSPKISLHINDSNMGSTANFLTALKRASQEVKHAGEQTYYMFCDQDDVWLKDKLYVTLKAMKRLERKIGTVKPSLIFTDAVLAGPDLSYIDNSFYKSGHRNVRNLSLSRLLIENKCIGCTIMMNKALVDMLGDNYESVRYHDWWMALIASSFGGIRFLRIPTLLYRQHSGNQVGQSGFAAYVKSRLTDRSDIESRLSDTIAQAQSFYECYKGRLGYKNAMIVNEFSKLSSKSFFMKRFLILRYRFFKSGILRNIALLLFI